MVRFILLSLALCFFIACSSKPSPEKDPKGFEFVDADFSWPVIPSTETDAFSWTITGFLPHDEHPYGFDKHPKPKKYEPEDSTVHISIFENADGGIVNVFVDPLVYGSSTGYKYGLCDLKSKKLLRELQLDNKGNDEYIFCGKESGSIDFIGLCKKLENSNKDNYIIYEKLKIHSYAPLQKEIALYLLGNGKKPSDFIQSTQFWENAVPEVYNRNIHYPHLAYILQNIPQSITLRKDESNQTIDSTARSANFLKIHVLNADSSCYESIKDDIDVAVERIRSFSQENNISRTILSITWPTRKIWSLKYDDDGFVQLCGTPTDSPESASEVQLVAGIDNVEYTPYVVRKKGDYWIALKKGANNETIEDTLTNENVDVGQMVFIESSRSYPVDNPYLGPHLSSSTAKAVTTFIEKENKKSSFDYDFAYILLPWRNERTGRVLLHEMGHAFGLIDLEDNLTNDDQSNQGNLMHWNDDRNGVLLRNRPINAKYIDATTEQQWDCLHRINPIKNCADSSILQFTYGE